MEQEKAKLGRPFMVLDTEQIEKLASLHCSTRDIAFVMGCHEQTLTNNYQENIDIGRANGRTRLRLAMFNNATQKYNAAVQIFLAKNLLGMSDVPKDEGDDGVLPWITPVKENDNNAEDI